MEEGEIGKGGGGRWVRGGRWKGNSGGVDGIGGMGEGERDKGLEWALGRKTKRVQESEGAGERGVGRGGGGDGILVWSRKQEKK